MSSRALPASPRITISLSEENYADHVGTPTIAPGRGVSQFWICPSRAYN